MELLPCPFCRSNDLEEWNLCKSIQLVECKKCEFKIHKKIWNTRHSPWISVKDKLPKMYEIVLTTNINNIDYQELSLARFTNKFQWEEQITSLEIKVTHWMKLPQLPEEKT